MVVGDDERDSIVGSGGLILPGTVDEGTRREVASCPGCRWKVTSPCIDSALGNSFDGQSHCRSVTRGCQVGSLRRTWFRPESGAWRDLGLMCVTDRPVTVADVGTRVMDRVEQRLPEASVSSLPATGVVTGLPTVFATGQSAGPREFDWTILGQAVRVTARPEWTWRFPDGTTLRTSHPGSLSPDGPVSHVFRRQGLMRVVCSVEWTGEYEIAGVGRFEWSDPVRQSTDVEVSVGEGRALLSP